MDKIFQIGVFDTPSNTCILQLNLIRPDFETVETLKTFLEYKFVRYSDNVDFMVCQLEPTDLLFAKAEHELVPATHRIYNEICKYYKLPHTQMPTSTVVVNGERMNAFTVADMLRTPGVYAEIDLRNNNVITTYRAVTAGKPGIVVDMLTGSHEDITEWLAFPESITKNYLYGRVYKLPIA